LIGYRKGINRQISVLVLVITAVISQCCLCLPSVNVWSLLQPVDSRRRCPVAALAVLVFSFYSAWSINDILVMFIDGFEIVLPLCLWALGRIACLRFGLWRLRIDASFLLLISTSQELDVTSTSPLMCIAKIRSVPASIGLSYYMFARSAPLFSLWCLYSLSDVGLFFSVSFPLNISLSSDLWGDFVQLFSLHS
jgi:hypothetical protein